MAIAPIITIPMGWLMVGNVAGALAGVPVGFIAGFAVHLYEWRTHDRYR
jgi:hypothetical protein